jgi:hypothetical protein
MTPRQPTRIPLDDLLAAAWDARLPIEFTPTEAHYRDADGVRFVAELPPVGAAR